MSRLPGTSAAELADDRDTLLIDIRPIEERHGVLGYVPGSYPLPMAGDAEAAAYDLLAFNQERRAAALICVSGRRSGEALALLAPHYPLTLTHLEGGILGWAEAGLPRCGVTDVSDGNASSLVAFKKLIRSCFVAEVVETSLDAGEDLDPMKALEMCLQAEKLDLDTATPDQLYWVIDRMAMVSRSMGAPLDKVAANVDQMTAMLDAIPEGTSGSP